jgi:hypothetical protein
VESVVPAASPLQLEKPYPVLAVAFKPTELPESYCGRSGDFLTVPFVASTVSANEFGGLIANAAVIDFAPSMVIVPGLTEPVRAPVHPVKW